MTGEQFRQMMREGLEQLIALNETKGRDYAGEDDALRNFKQHAGELGIAPEQVWAVFASKHWDAILTAARHAGDDGYRPSEPVEGRVRDLVVYLFLYLAMHREEIGPEDEVEADSGVYNIRRRDGAYWIAEPPLGGRFSSAGGLFRWQGSHEEAEGVLANMDAIDAYIVPVAEVTS
jgi:hypothetical protein